MYLVEGISQVLLASFETFSSLHELRLKIEQLSLLYEAASLDRTRLHSLLENLHLRNDKKQNPKLKVLTPNWLTLECPRS